MIDAVFLGAASALWLGILTSISPCPLATNATTPRALVGPKGGPNTGRVLISIMQAHGLMQDNLGLATGGPLPELMK